MRKRLFWIAPLAILAILLFAWIGGQLVMHLWNWLTPSLFGFQHITFWQALGLLVLCRILFGGFGGGRHRSNSRGRFRGKIKERMRERWEQMSSEERERFQEGFHDRGRGTTPLG
ncbi:MAG TPA: hypothetical protein VGN86_06545 [Pyrinomonadaceae bacterium]|jgi:hypothetical protein|nr:hypothetical protein [Pyrinomonadaceae bacterium]